MTTISHTLNSIIQTEIEKQGGVISFADFMSLSLYHPQYGYYHRASFKFGEGGDFTTASELTPLYAECFAPIFATLLLSLPTRTILELGAGSGRFAGDLLSALATQDALPSQYYIYEVSPALREQQRNHLQINYPLLVDRIQWLDTLPSSFSGIVIANEVLDALPIHRFEIYQGQVKECGVTIRDSKLDWQLSQPITPHLGELAEVLRDEYRLPNGYQSEIHLNLIAYVKSLTAMLSQGVLFFADYGYGREEYYHPQRTAGTLTCFKAHHHHADPFITPGEQDITAHVDFTRVIEAASTEGGTLLGYTTQAAFLLGAGLMDLANAAEKTLNEVDRFRLHQAIKTLTLPTEMGERIKVMAIAKGFDVILPAFNLKDRSRDL